MSVVLDLLTDLWRLAAIIEFAVVIFCGAYLHASFRRALPDPYWYLGWVYGAVLASVAAAIMINALSEVPMSPGQRVLTALVLPPTLCIAVLTTHVVRTR